MFKSSQKIIYIIILILFIINCLFISSCCQYEIKGTIRVTNEAGKAISGVKILQNTTILSHPNILPFIDSDEGQKNIQLHRNQSNENGEVCYSTQLFSPSRSYFIFYKEGYFPTFLNCFKVATRYGSPAVPEPPAKSPLTFTVFETAGVISPLLPITYIS